MKKIPTIKLTQAPLIMAFIKNIIPLRDDMPFNIEMLNDFNIIGMCGCGQSDCATVACEYDKEWDEEIQGSWGVNTNKGVVILHFLEDGFFELEAIDYEHFPYKEELHRLLHKNYTQPSDKELQELDAYFDDLTEEEMQVIHKGEIE